MTIVTVIAAVLEIVLERVVVEEGVRIVSPTDVVVVKRSVYLSGEVPVAVPGGCFPSSCLSDTLSEYSYSRSEIQRNLRFVECFVEHRPD